MFSAGTAAAAAAGGTTAGGMWLFSYNKENFGFDAGMRFGRFVTARGFANTQVEQYREDIEGIVGATATKMDAWQSVTTLFLCVGAALSCAGRIGMHGVAPPGWYCALFSGSIFMSVMFNGISLWLSMHASLRAQCAKVSLLTRKVRLPIPSMDQLDQARVFGSAFEKQDYRDIFRVPFMRHAQDAPEVASPQAEAGGKFGKKGKKNSSGSASPDASFGSTARDTVPSWIRDEQVVDKGNGFAGEDEEPLNDVMELPDHFKMLMKAQEEWRDYDIYARISMLYGVVSFLYAVTYYSVGYAIVELRGFWVMWTLPMVFMTAQALVLRLDIIRTGQHRLPNAEFLGHLAPFMAVAACTLEYRYYYSKAQVAVTWALALLALFGHFMMALRMLDLAYPDYSVSQDMPEEPGRQWWPSSWKVPSAFSRNLWFITPPKELQDGTQSCLVHEMEDLAAQGGGVGSKGHRVAANRANKYAAGAQQDAGGFSFGAVGDMGMKRGNDLPWRIVRVAILTAAFNWFVMMVVTGVEITMGTETLMKPPGEAPWIRDTKMRSWTSDMVHLSTSGALPQGYRLFSASQASYEQDGSAGHRRLAEAPTPVDDLLSLLPELTSLAQQLKALTPPAMPAAEISPVATEFLAAAPEVRRVTWPGLFEPRHLLCEPEQHAAVALTPRGFGAIAPLRDDGAVVAEPFSLDGLGMEGPLAGGAWTPRGLLLVTSKGKFLHCPGHTHQRGVWPCVPAEHPPLPVPQGAELLSAAVAHAADDTPRVALLFKHAPTMAAIFRAAEGEWHPTGEVHLPPGGRTLAFAAGAQELLMTAADGEVHRRHLAGGAHAMHPAPPGAERREFRSACAAPGGGILRLALRKAENAVAVPELM